MTFWRCCSAKHSSVQRYNLTRIHCTGGQPVISLQAGSVEGYTDAERDLNKFLDRMAKVAPDVDKGCATFIWKLPNIRHSLPYPSINLGLTRTCHRVFLFGIRTCPGKGRGPNFQISSNVEELKTLQAKMLSTPTPKASDDARMSDLVNDNRKLGNKIRMTLKKEQVRKLCCFLLSCIHLGRVV